MKILIVQDHLRSGGTERQSCLLANAFTEAGHPSALLTFRPGGSLADRPAKEVERIVLQGRDSGWDWYAPGLVRRAAAWSPDIVLCMGRMANCYAGRLAAGLTNAAVIATMRTGKTPPWLFRRSLRQVGHVVANSHDSRRVLVNAYRVPDEKVSVIHNALVFPAEARDRSDRVSVRIQHDADENTVVLLWVGMFRPEKNQREIVEIVGRLGPALRWQLWLAGEGVTRDGCARAVTERGLADRVKFLGFVRDPGPLYAAADLAVLTSRSESLSNFLIEAHAHGVPSIAYAVTGVDECGGLAIARDDQDGFVRELEQLMVDSTARAKESDRVRAFAREAFAPARQTQAYLDLFIRLTRSNAS